MDWNLKATSWDLTEFEQEAIPNIEAASSFGDHRARGDFSVDLKLGRVSNLRDEPVNKWKELGVSKMEASPSGSSKRARTANNGTHAVSCLVDGCDSDLSTCRDYHRRHKVCELHSKTPQVTINGQKQRFCQQCSRFHSLEEFDEGKRSCRKRLDGHNRRRRKPQPDPRSRSGSLFSNYQGSQLLSFSSSLVYPSTTVVNPTWAGVVNTETHARHYNLHQQLNLTDKQRLFLGSSQRSYKGGKQFTFLQGDSSTLNNQASPDPPVCQPLLRTIALSESGGGSHNIFCDRVATQVHDSDCALSLLSSPQTQTSGTSLNHMLQPNSISLVQPMGSSLRDHSLEPMDSVLVSSGRDADIHCPGLFHMGSDGSSGNKASLTLPFHWE